MPITSPARPSLWMEGCSGTTPSSRPEAPLGKSLYEINLERLADEVANHRLQVLQMGRAEVALEGFVASPELVEIKSASHVGLIEFINLATGLGMGGNHETLQQLAQLIFFSGFGDKAGDYTNFVHRTRQ